MISSTVIEDRLASEAGPAASAAHRRRTSHLKQMPLDRVVREQIRSACRRIAGQLDKSHPLSKDEMERVTRGALQELGQPEGYVGWTNTANSVWTAGRAEPAVLRTSGPRQNGWDIA